MQDNSTRRFIDIFTRRGALCYYPHQRRSTRVLRRTTPRGSYQKQRIITSSVVRRMSRDRGAYEHIRGLERSESDMDNEAKSLQRKAMIYLVEVDGLKSLQCATVLVLPSRYHRTNEVVLASSTFSRLFACISNFPLTLVTVVTVHMVKELTLTQTSNMPTQHQALPALNIFEPTGSIIDFLYTHTHTLTNINMLPLRIHILITSITGVHTKNALQSGV